MRRGRKRHTLSAGLLLFLLVGLFGVTAERGNAQESARLTVVAGGPAQRDVQPGRLVTLAFCVANLLPVEQTLTQETSIPPGWKALFEAPTFIIGPAGADVRLVTLSVPTNAAPGRQEVTYTLRDSVGNSTQASVFVNVLSRRNLLITLVESQRYVASGSSYSATFALSLDGNLGGTVRLNPRSSSDFPLDIDSGAVTIPPGDVRYVRTVVTTPVDIAEQRFDVLTLNAVFEGDTIPSAQATCGVTVLPIDGPGSDFRHRIPAYAAFRGGGENERAGIQGEFAALGTLFPERRGMIDIFVRTPDLQPYTILGARDEYHLRYGEESFDVFLGDLPYSLSPLTELSRFAFGGGGRVTVRDVTLGGFYNRSRYTNVHYQEAGGYISTALTQTARLAVNVLGKEDVERSGIVSVRTVLQPAKYSTIDAEFGRSYATDNHDDALSLRWTGSTTMAFYDLQYIQAGPRYTGYYRDVDLKNFNLILYPWSLLRFEAYAREEERNLSKDTTLFGAPRERFYELASGFGNYISARLRIRTMEDLMPAPAYNRKEVTGVLRSGYAAGFGSALAEAEFGTKQEKQRGTEGPYLRAALFVSLFPDMFQSYGATIEYLREPNLYGATSADRWAGSLNARLSITPVTHLYIGVQGNLTETNPQVTFTTVEGMVDHQFPFGHSILARFRNATFSLSTTGADFSWLVEYRIPFDIPLGRISTVGEISGRVIDSGTRAGLPDVVVSTGSKSVLTDAEGEFVIGGIAPGRHAVRVDVATLGRDRVLATQLDQPVIVRGGEASSLEIVVVQGGGISGSVMNYGFIVSASGDTLEGQYTQLEGVPLVLVEASQGSFTVRQFTDSHGRFQFTELRPGEWKLRLIHIDVPEGHYLDSDTIDVTLAPGGHQDAVFRILPKKRTIRILLQGELR